jgi:hypothetical protein
MFVFGIGILNRLEYNVDDPIETDDVFAFPEIPKSDNRPRHGLDMVEDQVLDTGFAPIHFRDADRLSDIKSFTSADFPKNMSYVCQNPNCSKYEC